MNTDGLKYIHFGPAFCMLCSITVITFGFVSAARTLSLSLICLLRLAHVS